MHSQWESYAGGTGSTPSPERPREPERKLHFSDNWIYNHDESIMTIFSLQELSWSCKDFLQCFYSDLRIPLSPPPPSSHKYFGYSSVPFASGILRWPVESLHQTGNLGRGNFVPRVLSYSSLPSRRGPLGTRAMGKRISSAQEARTEREEEERTITNPKSVGEMENSLFQQPLGLDSRNAPRACLFRQ